MYPDIKLLMDIKEVSIRGQLEFNVAEITDYKSTNNLLMML